MPIYEYACKSCDAKFEQLVRRMSGEADGPSAKCPACGSDQTARALSVFAVNSESAGGGQSEDPMCGRCGGAPGSCGMG
jgi:putative FmdB family regulatory protein